MRNSIHGCCRACLYCLLFLFSCKQSFAQARWFGKAGDGQWTSPLNWAGNVVPAVTDDVILDNSLEASGYTVYLPAGTSNTTVKSITISPAAGNQIQLVLPVGNTAAPALSVTGPGYGITINNNGSLLNASGASSAGSIVVADSIRINNGGMYVHNTRSGHAAMVTVLSKAPGTEKGIFSFDAPGGGYTIATTGRTYGTLLLNATASGGAQSYATSAASPLIINGDLIIKTGVTLNLDITAPTIVYGNYVQEGGVFNLASQPNNNTVYIKGDLLQSAGSITETSAGLPVIAFNGKQTQQVNLSGGINNSVAVHINNHAGINLLSNMVLPYQLHLIDGIVNCQSFLVNLQAGCGITADSLSNNSFINGPLRKEGLSAATHFLFPIGKGITQRWLALKQATGNYTAEFVKGNPSSLASNMGTGIHHVSSIEYWTLQADALPAPSAKLELSFDNVNSGGVTDMATLRVAELSAAAWNDKGNTSTTGTAGSSGSVISMPLTAFDAGVNYFSLASSNAFQNPLPLQLLSFTARPVNNDVIINWLMAEQWQPAYLELQSSADGIYFTSLSPGSSIAGQRLYQYTDKSVAAGSRYYRLKSLGTDGSISYSNNIRIDIPVGNEMSLLLYPSLVHNSTHLLFQAAKAGAAQINIYGWSGSLLKSIPINVQQGSNRILLSVQSLPPGIYVIVIKRDDGSIVRGRMVKG